MAEESRDAGRSTDPAPGDPATPPHPPTPLPNPPCSLLRPLREVGRASPAPPHARRRKEASSTSASARSLLSPQPAARSILLRSVFLSLAAEGGGGEVSSVTLSPLPFPRDGDHGPLPPDMAGSPRGCLRERSPTPGPPPPRRGPPPRCPPPPRDEARREGAGPRGPARSPTPRRRSGEGVTHLAVEGFHGLHVAAEAGAGRLLSADGGRAGPRPGGGLLSVCVCVCASLRGRRASSPWRLAQGAGAEGRGPRLVSVSSRQRSASSPRFPPGGADVPSPARLRSAAPAGDGGTTRSSCGAGANMADTRGLLAAQLREEPRAAQAATAPPAGRRPPAGPRHRGADGMAERTAPPAFLRAGPGRGRGAGSRRQVKGYEDKVFNAAVFRHRG